MARPWSARCYGVARQREGSGHRLRFDDRESVQHAGRQPTALTWFSTLSAREGADGQAVVCPLLRGSSATRGVAPKQHRTRRLLTNRPCSSLVYEESDSKERLRVSNWIVQRLYNYAVKKTVEL